MKAKHYSPIKVTLFVIAIAVFQFAMGFAAIYFGAQ